MPERPIYAIFLIAVGLVCQNWYSQDRSNFKKWYSQDPSNLIKCQMQVFKYFLSSIARLSCMKSKCRYDKMGDAIWWDKPISHPLDLFKFKQLFNKMHLNRKSKCFYNKFSNNTKYKYLSYRYKLCWWWSSRRDPFLWLHSPLSLWRDKCWNGRYLAKLQNIFV